MISLKIPTPAAHRFSEKPARKCPLFERSNSKPNLHHKIRLILTINSIICHSAIEMFSVPQKFNLSANILSNIKRTVVTHSCKWKNKPNFHCLHKSLTIVRLCLIKSFGEEFNYFGAINMSIVAVGESKIF